MGKAYGGADVADGHGVPLTHRSSASPLGQEAVIRDGDVPNVSDEQGDEVVAHDPQLAGRVEDGHADEEEEEVGVAELLGDEEGVGAAGEGAPWRGGELFGDEPVWPDQAREGAA